MNNKIMITAIPIVSTILFGLLLTRLGKPYNAIIFNVHKLIALGFVVYSGILVKNIISSEGITSLLVVAVVLLFVGVIGLFATGAMMSIGGFNDALLKNIHIITMITLVAGYGLFVVKLKQ